MVTLTTSFGFTLVVVGDAPGVATSTVRMLVQPLPTSAKTVSRTTTSDDIADAGDRDTPSEAYASMFLHGA